MSVAARRILVLDGHPDPDPAHFVHALAEAYAGAASEAGHEVLRKEIAKLDFPLLRKPSDWLTGEPPEEIARLQADIEWADHLVLLYPLWLGDVPALLKGVLEQVLRPGFALEYRTKGLPRKLLGGRSARIVVTMGMPALFYRWVYSAHSLKSLERNILKFVGFAPVEHTLLGGVDNLGNRRKGLEEMLELGARGA
ncbi:MAG: dehydrogenase [Sphingomonadales bacterium 12-68-11]|nr:MAG: dehydrogenase [Sphingomonadales bacterium 12-68-11]